MEEAIGVLSFGSVMEDNNAESVGLDISVSFSVSLGFVVSITVGVSFSEVCLGREGARFVLGEVSLRGIESGVSDFKGVGLRGGGAGSDFGDVCLGGGAGSDLTGVAFGAISGDGGFA